MMTPGKPAEAVLIIDDRCVEMARDLSRIRVRIDDFSDPRFYPPREAEEELVADYFFFMVAIDHRTSIGGRLFEGIVEGERFRGSDLLYRLGALKFAEDPEFFTPERMARLTVDEARRWLSVREPRPAVVPGLEERVELLRDAARHILEHYDGRVMNLYAASGRRLAGEDGLLARLAKIRAYSDPIAKKPFLLVKFMIRRGLWRFDDPWELRVPVDNHLARVALRYGIIEVADAGLRRKLQLGLPATEAEDLLIRGKAREAYARVAAYGGLDPTVMDDILWHLGRSCCWDKRALPACREPRCSLADCSLKRILLTPCDGCPLRHGCLAASDDEHLRLREPNFERTWYY